MSQGAKPVSVKRLVVIAAVTLFVSLGIAAVIVVMFSTTKMCTLLGCPGGPIVSFSSPTGRWPEGTYTFRITTPQQTYTCVVQPEHIGSLSGPGPRQFPKCSPYANISLFSLEPDRRRNEAKDAAPDRLRIRWTAMAYGFGFPHSIDLAIERDGKELVRERRAPVYEDQYRNGPDCGVSCISASVGITLPVGGE